MTISELMGPLYKSFESINPNLKSEDETVSNQACRDVASKIFTRDEPQTIAETVKTIQSKINSLQGTPSPQEIKQLFKCIRIINQAIDRICRTTGAELKYHIVLKRAMEQKFKSIIKQVGPSPVQPQKIRDLRSRADRIAQKLITLQGFYTKTLSKKDYIAAEHDEAYIVFDIKKDLEEMEANLPTDADVPRSIMATSEMARKLLGEYEARADFMALSKSKEELFQTIVKNGLPKKINATMQRRLERIYAKEAAILLFSGDDHRKAEAIQRLAILHDAIAKVPNFSGVFFKGSIQQIQAKIESRGPSLFFPEIANLEPQKDKDLAQAQFEQVKKLKITSPFLLKQRKLFQKAIADTFIADNKELYDELVTEARILKELAGVVQKNPDDFEASKKLDAAFAAWKHSFSEFNTSEIFDIDDFGLNEVNVLLVNSKWVQSEMKKVETDYEKRLREKLPHMNDFKVLRAYLAALKASVMIRAPLCVRFTDIIPGKLMDVAKKCRSDTHHQTLDEVLTDITYPASKKPPDALLPRFNGEAGSFEKQIEVMKKLGGILDTVREVLPDSPEKKELGEILTALAASGDELQKIVAPLKGAKEPQIPNPQAFCVAQQAYMKNCDALLQFLSPLQRYIKTIEQKPEIGPALRQACELCSATLLGGDEYPKNLPPSALFFPGAPGLRTIPVLFSQMLPRMEMPLQVILSCHKNDEDRLWLINTLLATQAATHNVNEFLRKYADNYFQN